jgi:hypothetical protein
MAIEKRQRAGALQNLAIQERPKMKPGRPDTLGFPSFDVCRDGKTRSERPRRAVDPTSNLRQIISHFHKGETLSFVQSVIVRSKSGFRRLKTITALSGGCLLPTVGIVSWSAVSLAAPPKIDLIELYPREIAIHFETEPNRKYELQYTDRPADLTNRTASTWANLYVAESLPIPMHYVINDSRTNKNRFYRLKATP